MKANRMCVLAAPTTFYRLPSLVRAIEKNADRFEVLSLDLFDTLLVRRIPDPDQVKIPVARYIAERAVRAGVPVTWEQVQRERDAIEQAQRRENGRRFPDSEACYPVFMGELLNRIFQDRLPERMLQEITDWELTLEKAVLVPRALFQQLLPRLHAAGKQIWIMSDMYLPASHIRVLVEYCGLMPWITGIVSSADTCQAKASGAGYDRLQREQHFNPARWLHVGDNVVSDGLRPVERGIRAFVLRDAAEKFRKAMGRRYEQAARARPFWQGRLVQQIMLPLEAENNPRDPLYVAGYTFFGVLVGAFIQHLAERVRALKLRRIYFFSREGDVFLKCWERARPFLFPAGGAPEARYLYVSRVALAGATCARRGLTHADAPLALLPAGSRDLRDICRVFGLAVDGLQEHFARHGLAPDSPLNPIYPGWTDELWHRFDLLLHDPVFQQVVKQQTREIGGRVERYLEQEGFFENPEVAVVDVGWLGTIQRFLHEAIAHRPDKPRLHGLAFGASRGIPYPTAPNNYLDGFLFDGNRFDFAASLVTYALDIFEEAFRAPHAGVAGYEERDGRVVPRLQPETSPGRQKEIRQDAYYAPLQQGILDAVPRYAAAVCLAGLTSADIKPWLNHLVAMRLAFPKVSEMRILQGKHHFDEYTGGHRPPLKVKLFLLKLWKLDPWVVGIPFIRLGFYVWNAYGLAGTRRAWGIWLNLKRLWRAPLAGLEDTHE